ncbi:hypothetical protein BpHYR1_005250 [Brachionus plicatilis]|uniref:Uncharacterized protein n=1 Tax=Brachionus plicatilis TaxID=10195 RepID=A0A3M7QG32_BRAPC|nr:hypothetical protein BpHYR1_005250 [Brachionus plicatilis]
MIDSSLNEMHVCAFLDEKFSHQTSKFSKASKCNIKLNCFKVELNSKKYSCNFEIYFIYPTSNYKI